MNRTGDAARATLTTATTCPLPHDGAEGGSARLGAEKLRDLRNKVGDVRAHLKSERDKAMAELRGKAEERKRDAYTVAKLVREYLDQLRTKSAPETARVLERHLVSRYGDLPAAELTEDHAQAIFDSLSHSPIMANRLIALCRTLDRWAIKKKRVPRATPFTGTAIELHKEKPHTVILRKTGELEAFLNLRGKMDAEAFDALELVLRLGTRPGEVAAMRWDELDLDEAVWTIPENKTKNGHEHRVMLPVQVVTWLRSRRRTGDHVFARPTAAGGVLNADMMGERFRQVVDTLPVAVRPHDLRRSCLSHVSRLGFGKDVRDAIANHHVASIDKIYDQWDYEPEARKALQRWSDELDAIRGGDVLVFKKRA